MASNQKDSDEVALASSGPGGLRQDKDVQAIGNSGSSAADSAYVSGGDSPDSRNNSQLKNDSKDDQLQSVDHGDNGEMEIGENEKRSLVVPQTDCKSSGFESQNHESSSDSDTACKLFVQEDADADQLLQTASIECYENFEKNSLVSTDDDCSSKIVINDLERKYKSSTSDDSMDNNLNEYENWRFFLLFMVIMMNVFCRSENPDPPPPQPPSSSSSSKKTPKIPKSTGVRCNAKYVDQVISGITSRGSQECQNNEEDNNFKKKNENIKKKIKTINLKKRIKKKKKKSSLYTGPQPFFDIVRFPIQEETGGSLAMDIILTDRGRGTRCMVEEPLPYGVQEESFGTESELCLPGNNERTVDLDVMRW